jgi:hypothetical protein
MQRRTFLQLVGAASLAPAALAQDQSDQSATVLYSDRATPVAPVRRSPTDPATLWVRQQDLPRINDFEIKPEGACRADLCIPIASDMLRDDYFNLTAFAARIRQAVPYFRLDHFNSTGNIFQQRFIIIRTFGIRRRVHNRLPSKLAQVLNKLQPALYTRTTGWWPVVSNDEDLFMRSNHLT